MKKNNKNKNLYIRITEKEESMIKILRNKYNVNISQLFRNTIFDYYTKMEEDNA